MPSPIPLHTTAVWVVRIKERGAERGSTEGRFVRTVGRMAGNADCIPILKALGDETRWRIVRELLKRTLTVNEIAERLGVTQYNVSKHLRILREAGIVVTEKDGKNLNCTVDAELKQRIARNRNQLELGCCSFRFD
jgi:DNA-binding transcriptional ArsR family regulator